MVHCQETTGGQGVHREVESEGLAEKELDEGYEWVVDADLKDFFGSVDHDKLLELVNQRVSDGRVLGLLRQMLTAGVVAEGKRLLTDQGTPQGGIVSPVLSEPSDKSGKHPPKAAGVFNLILSSGWLGAERSAFDLAYAA